MALVIADRVRETTSSAGTGTITLTGAFSGFQPFSVIGNGNTTYYTILDTAGSAWEVGIGTYTTLGNTLSRDTVLSSSNSGARVPFATGLKDVICTQPSERNVYVVGSDVVAENNAKVPNSLLANSAVTVNGNSVSLGGSTTVTAATTNALTLGNYLSGTSFNGSAAVTTDVNAASANTANALVARDAFGSFSAGVVTATRFSGPLTGAVGDITPAAGAFTTLAASGAVTLSGGNLLVGVTSGSQHTISKARSSDVGEAILDVTRQSTGIRSLSCYAVSQEVFNTAACAVTVGRSSPGNRSINAGGTVNASGADYAEYMVKAGEFTIAKGDVVGINADGKLTNVFFDAISFCVKSTDPSYVGGDSWGIGFENDAEGLEAARQTVDRIAFAGQAPVNVMGATAGQYIIPVNDNGAIKGEAVSSPTFEQYQQAVGKVIAIEADGRARIIVKVA